MYGDEFKLASLDFMGDTSALEAKAREAMTTAGPAFRAPDRQEGADSSGSIRVTLDRQGAVQDVQVEREWKDRLQPAEFPAALFAAYSSALARVVEADALETLIGEDNKSDDDREWDERRRSEDVRFDLRFTPPEDDNAWLRATWDKIHELDEKLHRLSQPSAAAPEERAVSPYGHLVVTHQGQTVTGITGDPEWIRTTDPNQLRPEALAVFRKVRNI